jgi:hypothetical protein
MIDFVNIFMFLGLLLLLIERISNERAVTEDSRIFRIKNNKVQILSNMEGQS